MSASSELRSGRGGEPGPEETLLAAAQARYGPFFEQLPFAAYIDRLDETSSNVFTSRQVEPMLGYTVEDWRDDPDLFVKLLHPDDRERVLGEHAQMRATGQRLSTEYRALAKDGRVVWLRDEAVVVAGEHGERFLHGYLLDVSGRKLAEEELELRVRQQEAVAELGLRALEQDLATLFQEAVELVARTLGTEYATILEREADGESFVVVADAAPETTLVGASIPASSQAGYTLRSATPVVVEDLTTETRFPTSALARARAARSGISCAIQGEDGPFGVIGAHATAVHAFTEHDVHFLRAIANVLAGALRRSRAEEEQTRLEQQLRQAQKLEAVGRLAGGVAHDFNNLLLAIGGYSELALSRTLSDDELRRDIQEIKRAADRAGRLTRQLLAFSRRQVLEPQALEVNAVVGEMELMLRRLIGDDVELVTQLEAESSWVLADRGQLEQVIVNLGLNARDAMPEGGTLTIATRRAQLDAGWGQTAELPAGSYVTVSVTDTGHGMDVETQLRAFEPFFTTKELGKGTGLGLATVHGIVRQSGGDVWVTSEVGRGTTVRVCLPAIEAPAERVFEPERQVPPTGSETILLVEDNDLVRRLVVEMLRRLGYTVIAAASGPEALELLDEQRAPIDLVLTDLVMPKMSGSELAERLRAARPRLAVLYMSGYSEDTSLLAEDGSSLAAAYLEKPFSAVDLARTIRAALERVTQRDT